MRDRGDILSDLFTYQQLQPLWRLAHWAYRSPSDLFLFERGVLLSTLRSANGVKQGDGLGSLLFSLSVHKFYKRCTRECPDTLAIAVADDLSLVGPANSVFHVFDTLTNDIKGSGLTLRRPKCAVLWPDALAPPDLLSSAKERGLPVYTGSMVLLGAPVGQLNPVLDSWLHDQVTSHQRFFDLLVRPDLPTQIAYLLLRLSALPSLAFLTRVVVPSVLEPHLTRFDNMVSRTACTILGLPDPLPDAALNFLALPIKLGGLGLRPLSMSAPAAFWSSFALAAPDILSLIPDDLREVCLAPGRLQRAICSLIDQRVVAEAFTTMSRTDKQRVVSCQANGSGSWLTVIPSSICLPD